jgi:hypothetical protein
MHDARQRVKKCFEPIGSLVDIEPMGRPKNFNREGVLEKALRGKATAEGGSTEWEGEVEY